MRCSGGSFGCVEGGGAGVILGGIGGRLEEACTFPMVSTVNTRIKKERKTQITVLFNYK